MSSGVDPAFEVTEQRQWMSGDSGIVTTPALAQVSLGFVQGGQQWEIERLVLRYRPGDFPTDPQVYFRLVADKAGLPTALRDAVQLTPLPGFVAGRGYDFAADYAAPVLFQSGEQVYAVVPLYGSMTNRSRLVVNAQVRIVSRITGGGQADTEAVEPVAEVDQPPQHEPAWN